MAGGAHTVHAKSRVVAKRVAPKGATQIYLHHAFIPGHRYQIKVGARVHTKVVGFATEYFTSIYQKQLHTYSKEVALKGMTPRTVVLTVPSKIKGVASWGVAASVSTNNARSRLTLQFIDQGH